MKILQVAAPTAAGGLERVVESLAIGLHRRGHDVAVATLLFGDDPDLPFVEALTEAGVTVLPIPMTAREYLRERREIEAVCRSFRPDIVHTHGHRIDVVDRPVAARLGIRTATTVHGASKTGGRKGQLQEWLQRKTFRFFDAVAAVSRRLYDVSLADGVPEEKLHLIPNAWSGLIPPLPRPEARRLLGVPQDAPVLGWVGRLIPVKGGDVFLDALSLLPEPRPTAVLIGYGMEEERLREKAEAVGVTSTTLFKTDLMDAGRYFKAFDAFVISSRSEGLPITLLEAMAAEVPVISTAVGGIPEAVGDEEAWLVPPEDPGALADAMLDALSNPERAAERARAGLELMEREYSMETFLDRYERAYAAALRG